MDLLEEDKGSDYEFLGEEFRSHVKILEAELAKSSKVLKVRNGHLSVALSGGALAKSWWGPLLTPEERQQQQ